LVLCIKETLAIPVLIFEATPTKTFVCLGHLTFKLIFVSCDVRKGLFGGHLTFVELIYMHNSIFYSSIVCQKGDSVQTLCRVHSTYIHIVVIVSANGTEERGFASRKGVRC
jgi:hypothetical protein